MVRVAALWRKDYSIVMNSELPANHKQIPYMFSTVLALVTENVSIFGSRRKNYLILLAPIAIFALLLLILFGKQLGKIFIITCILITYVSMI